MASRALTEDDIPGASLAGRSPATLKNKELRFWLKCRGDSLKGLKTKAQLVKRVEDYIKAGRDQNIVDPDPNSIYTKRKERNEASKDSNSAISGTQRQPNFPSDGWSTDLKRMPFFTRAEMNLHIAKSGENIDSTSKSHSVPTGVRKATIFLNDEYLKDISTASDENFFYFKSHCYHSFRKNDAPHNLKVALCIVSGEMTCSKNRPVHPLYNSGIGREGETINPQPAMEVLVTKTYLEETRSSARDPGVRCLLYEARKNIRRQQADEEKLLVTLKELNPKMALAQILTPRSESIPLLETKFGRSPQGSYASYQLSVTEDNFKVYCDITSVTRVNPGNHSEQIITYPRFPLKSSDEQFEMPTEISEAEKSLLDSLQVDADKLNDIERKHGGNQTVQNGRRKENFDSLRQILVS
ncbi:hypothetical protein OS493_000553 [Desmophyllum pertusum]|uniref:SAP domain-containing protein n=1 Tax=Desmophyllum pertusum TaxID=174260 RepID=A0A9X0A7E4_9CNID|nr:hypothetical protein OS493_000553 [Desmophyllum pertusum]